MHQLTDSWSRKKKNGLACLRNFILIMLLRIWRLVNCKV